MNISLESCTAVSNAITGKGPRVDYTTFKAHVPEHVSREGKILFKQTLVLSLVDLVSASLAIRGLLTDVDKLDPKLTKALIDAGYVTEDGLIRIHRNDSSNGAFYTASVGGLEFITEDEEALGESQDPIEDSNRLLPFGKKIIWLQGEGAEDNFVFAAGRNYRRSEERLTDLIVPSRVTSEYKPASWTLAEVIEAFGE